MEAPDMSSRPLRDLKRALTAVASNALARFAPGVYVRLTRQTGRGTGDVGAEHNADYFRRCYRDYCQQLALDPADAHALQGCQVLEYGPGDILGVALLCIAHGASRVVCVDRFPLERLSEENIAIYRALLDGLDGEARAQAASAFRRTDDPGSGLDPARIEYRVTADGSSGEQRAFDLILSRAVLEHVHDLPTLFGDMQRALTANGVALHQVDLKSHGLDRDLPFDFLAWPGWLYALMYSHKGFPNRWRVGRYRAWARAAGLLITTLEPTALIEASALQQVRSRIRSELCLGSSEEELRWQGFWLKLARGGGSEH
jgi:SAM-dependent methyltransferase